MSRKLLSIQRSVTRMLNVKKFCDYAIPLLTGLFSTENSTPLKQNYSQGRSEFVKNLLPIKKVINISFWIGLTFLPFDLWYSVLHQLSSIANFNFYHFLAEIIVIM